MIELTYKKNVEEYIGNNLEVLEASLDKAAQKYLKLEKKNLDFGQKLTPQNLESLAPTVIAKTMDFLEVKQSTECYLSMFYLPYQLKKSFNIAAGTFALANILCALDSITASNILLSGMLGILFGAGHLMLALDAYSSSSFECKNSHLMVGATKTVNAVGAIAHEYTHCLQHNFTQLNLMKYEKNPIVEGHARGLEGIISEKYSQEFNNEAYTYVHSERVVKELKRAYLYTCGMKEITPKKSLEKLPIPSDILYFRDIDHYSIGVTAMTIACSKHGEKIYKDIMKNDFEFLRK